MEFLRCTPSVFVIGDEYEILVNATENGIFSIRVGEITYYEENSGVLSSEKNFAKIRVPQRELDRWGGYTVTYRLTIKRRSYYSELSEPFEAYFEFKPLVKKEGINLYLISDVHYHFDVAESACGFFGDDVDVFVVNGDIGEVRSEENYFEVCRFVGNISGGRIPVIFVRGNHDARGRLAERFTDYFPCESKNTYYTFSLGNLCGVAIDCGEDKPDSQVEYGGVNRFEAFRRRETEFLKKVTLDESKIRFAVSHICPAQAIEEAGCIFDIERDVYTEWNRELSRMGISFMLCGHIHKAYILEKNDKASLLPHDYSVVVGGATEGAENIVGSAITLYSDSMTVRFTDKDKTIRKEMTVEY